MTELLVMVYIIVSLHSLLTPLLLVLTEIQLPINIGIVLPQYMERQLLFHFWMRD